MTWWQTLLDNLEHADAAMKVLIGVTVTLAIFWKKVANGFGHVVVFFKDCNTALQIFVGRRAYKHPDTGEVLVPATLPLNQRLAVIEKQGSDTAEAIKLLAENQSRMIKVEETIAGLQSNWDRREREGMMIIQEWEQWRKDHMTYSDDLRADVDRIKELVEHIDNQTSP